MGTPWNLGCTCAVEATHTSGYSLYELVCLVRSG